MTERARHLAERVFPGGVRVRQWVLSLPFDLRYRAAFDHELARAIARITAGAIETRYRRLAVEAGLREPRGGSVVVMQRFSSDLRTNLHLHGLFLDGGYGQDERGARRFVRAPAPSPAEVEAVLARIVADVRGRLEEGEPELDEPTRKAILRLRAEGHGTRTIADLLGVSRGAVKNVLRSGSAVVPPIFRTEKAEPHRDLIVELFTSCKGNLVRVHEELVRVGAELSYPGLTAFCRRHGIGHPPAEPAGQYHFEPGQEMQHDTSPHEAPIGGRTRRMQTASLVLCYSRMIFAQSYPRFTRSSARSSSPTRSPTSAAPARTA